MKSAILGFVQLSRPDLSFAAGLCVVLGQLLSLGALPPWYILSTGFFSVYCISAAILVMNDYLDVASDVVNAPHRPIPSGRVSKTAAGYFAVVLGLSGWCFSLSISLPAGVIAFVLTVIGVLYNRYFKQSGLFGNVLVCVSVGMTFIYGGVTVGNPYDKTVIFFAVLTAMIDLGEEIAADITDIEGDRLIQSKSIAIRYGRKTAVNISSMVFGLIVVLTALPFIVGWFNWIYAIPLGLLDILIIIAVIKFRSAETGNSRQYIKLIYRGGTIVLLVFLIMKLCHV